MNANLQVEDVTGKLSKGAQALLAKRFSHTIAELNEERPCGKDLKSRLERTLKKLVIKLEHSLTTKLPRLAPLIPPSLIKLSNKWAKEVFYREVWLCVYVGFTVKKTDIDKGIKRLSDLIEFELGKDVIKGSLCGAFTLELATEAVISPNEVRKLWDESRVVVASYIMLSKPMAGLVRYFLDKTSGNDEELKRLGLFQEGGLPPELSFVDSASELEADFPLANGKA